MKPVARIENWREVSDFNGNHFLIGVITGHKLQTKFERDLQQTSNIIARFEGKVETRNTIYILGEPYDDTVDTRLA